MYHERGFELIAFPANQFGCQAPYSSAVEREYAFDKFGMQFPVYDKIGVKRRGNPQCDGPQEEHPLYKFLKREKPFSEELEWNYVKVSAAKTRHASEHSPSPPTSHSLTLTLSLFLSI